MVKYLSEPYIIQEDKTTYGQVSKAGDLSVKSYYLIIVKEKENYIGKKQNQTECCGNNP